MSFHAIAAYLTRPSTAVAAGVSLALYLPLALQTRAWAHPVLLALAVLVIPLGPRWAQLTNLVEDRILLRWPSVTVGRLGRLAVQLPATYMLMWALAAAGVVAPIPPAEIGRTALGITVAGQGFQYVALRLANRGRGHKHRNVLAALAGTALLIALARVDVGGLVWVSLTLLWTGGLLAAAEGIVVLSSDLRSIVYPQGGIGLFLGTFNPMHTTHIAIIRRALHERRLERVLIHPTVIPKLHLHALQRREIEIVTREAGMRVYGKTASADRYVNYFPTGNRFFEHETRALMIGLSLSDAGLDDKVNVLLWCDIYERRGFYGVVDEVKRRYPGRPIHGLHGSDTGGMWNRAIYDESGWIYPFPVARVDGLSATAIRNGAAGMMTPTAQAVVRELKRGAERFSVGGRDFAVRDGVVSLEPD